MRGPMSMNSEVVEAALDGKGSSGTDEFYNRKKTLKAAAKALNEHLSEVDKSFLIPVEIFYWFDEDETGFVNIGEFYTTVSLSKLKYRIAIRIPEGVSDKDVKDALQTHDASPYSSDIKIFHYTAGKTVQVMHLGPFADELKTLPRLQQFAESNNYVKRGMHHEIHLSDFERGDDQTHFKTILRDPVISIPKTMR